MDELEGHSGYLVTLLLGGVSVAESWEFRGRVKPLLPSSLAWPGALPPREELARASCLSWGACRPIFPCG